MTTRIGRTVRSILVAATVVTGTLAATAPAASAATRTYTQAGFHCQWEGNVRVVTAVAPRSMTSWYGGLEDVRWQPSLFRWDGTRWAYYATKPGSLGVAGSGGLVNNSLGVKWISAASTAYTASYWDFRNLPAGSYRIADYLGWDRSPNGIALDASAWSWVQGTSSTYCYF